MYEIYDKHTGESQKFTVEQDPLHLFAEKGDAHRDLYLLAGTQFDVRELSIGTPVTWGDGMKGETLHRVRPNGCVDVGWLERDEQAGCDKLHVGSMPVTKLQRGHGFGNGDITRIYRATLR